MEIMVPAWVDGTLQPVEKLAAHERGLRHMAVSVFVIAEGRLLLQQRALGKYHTPGLWANTCCTHPLWGEDPADCAVRRLGQELGLTGLAPDWRQQIEYRADVGGGLTEHEVVEVYLARVPAPVALNPDPAEVMATRWIALPDLHAEIAAQPERFTPWLLIYLERYATSIFGPDQSGSE